MKSFVTQFAAVPFIVLAAACGGDDAARLRPATPTDQPPAQVTHATPPPSATPGAAATPPREATVSPQAGTMDPFRAAADPNPPRGIALLQAWRVGAQTEGGGWDRIVFEFKDARPAVEVSYVEKATTCGKGDDVKLPGAAMLSVRFRQTQAHTDAGVSTLSMRQLIGPGNAIFRSVLTCDFEGEVEVAMGIRTKQPYKVTLLQNPTRVVVDIKQ